MSINYYTDGEIWATGNGWRVGIRCDHKLNEPLIEVVYQEGVMMVVGKTRVLFRV